MNHLSFSLEITECFRKNLEECPIDQICRQDFEGSYKCFCPEKGYEVVTSGGNSKCQGNNSKDIREVTYLRSRLINRPISMY